MEEVEEGVVPVVQGDFAGTERHLMVGKIAFALGFQKLFALKVVDDHYAAYKQGGGSNLHPPTGKRKSEHLNNEFNRYLEEEELIESSRGDSEKKRAKRAQLVDRLEELRSTAHLERELVSYENSDQEEIVFLKDIESKALTQQGKILRKKYPDSVELFGADQKRREEAVLHELEALDT